jgi:hypothetical protein
MSATTLDTHRTVKRLMEAGFSPEQAETVTDVLVETRALDLSELATKADLRTLEAQLTAALRTVEGSLRSDLRTADGNLKGDLRTVEGNLKGDLRTVEGNLKGDVKALEAKIADTARTTLQWVVGMFIAQIAIFAGLVKLLAGH